MNPAQPLRFSFKDHPTKSTDMSETNYNSIKDQMEGKANSSQHLPPDAGLKGLSTGCHAQNMAGISIDVSENKNSGAMKRAASPLSDDSVASSTNHNEKRRKTQEEKKMDRILANRRSARKSRERRKKLQENLELSVSYLSKQNEELSKENELLKQEMQTLKNLLFGRMNFNGVGPTNPGGAVGLLQPANLLQGIDNQIFQQHLPPNNDSQSLLTALLTAAIHSNP